MCKPHLVAPLMFLVGCGQKLPEVVEPPPPEATPEPERTEPVASAPALPPVWYPNRLEDVNPDPAVVEVTLRAVVATVNVAGVPLEMYTYNGVFPGPLLEAKPGDRIIVHFSNELPEATTIHWHGLRISDQMDGSPRIQSPVPPGGTFTYDFVAPEPGSFWYHPHLRANEQVEKGLYGPIAIRSPNDPVYDGERFLMLDDVLLAGNGFAPFLQNHMEEMHGRFGNVLLTNGIESSRAPSGVARFGAVERWRIVNTANARTMRLSVKGAHVRVIGTDGGLLARPYVAEQIELAVGNRYDLEVWFESLATVELESWVLTRNSTGQIEEKPLPVFAVEVGTPAKDMVLPAWNVPELPSRAVDSTVTIELNGASTSQGLEWTINGKAHSTEPLFTFAQGQTVKMVIKNMQGPEHPFHLHGQFFRVLEPAMPGLRDTVLVPGMSTVEIEAWLDNPGRWMAHCHILEHAELGMMSELVVTPK